MNTLSPINQVRSIPQGCDWHWTLFISYDSRIHSITVRHIFTESNTIWLPNRNKVADNWRAAIFRNLPRDHNICARNSCNGSVGFIWSNGRYYAELLGQRWIANRVSSLYFEFIGATRCYRHCRGVWPREYACLELNIVSDRLIISYSVVNYGSSAIWWSVIPCEANDGLTRNRDIVF